MEPELREHSRVPYPVLEHLRDRLDWYLNTKKIKYSVQKHGIERNSYSNQSIEESFTCEGISRKSRSTSKAESSLYSGRAHSTCITWPNSWNSVRTSECARSEGVGGSDEGLGRGKLASIAAIGSWRDPSCSCSEFCALDCIPVSR